MFNLKTDFFVWVQTAKWIVFYVLQFAEVGVFHSASLLWHMQAVRNESDLKAMAVPPKYQKMNTFYKYVAVPHFGC